MRRAGLVAAALGALAAACTSKTAPTETIGFRQPSALAIFRGLTVDAPTSVRPYLAVANAARNDLTLVDAQDDTAVWAPVQLRAATLPVMDRPSLLVAASLGDDDPAVTTDDKPDLLVAVSAGDSVLQVVATWDPSNEVFSDPVAVGAEVPLAVDLGADVLAVAAVPAEPGRVRIAAALAGKGIAVVEYARAASPSVAIVRTGDPVFRLLDFQPVALAAAPDDPATVDVQTAIFAASLEPIIGSVYGVALLTPDLAAEPVALDARGPTRLVAAARIAERDPLSAAKDATAFTGRKPEVRVYAVLDESGCGIDRRVPCGVVTLDPAAGGIPDDWSGAMPYRAPIPIPGRPLAIAVAPPALVPPEGYTAGFMRLYAGAIETATTAVGAVASDDGRVYFLDLGRFKAATGRSSLRALTVAVGAPADVDTDPSTTAQARRRLWLQQDQVGTFVPDASGSPDATAAAKTVRRTPGWTRTSSATSAWRVTWQGVLPELLSRLAEAGVDAGGRPWLALQTGYGAAPSRYFSQVVKLHHPALGLRPGDIAVIKAAGVPGCIGERPPGTPPDKEDSEVAFEFEAEVAELVPPDPAVHPGGAVILAALDPTGHPAWKTCVDALRAIPAGQVLTRLVATLRARELVVVADDVGYVGRPVADAVVPNAWHYALEYPVATKEDALATTCPLVDWEGASPAPTCDATTCRPSCEAAVLARKARRVLHVFEDCATDGDDTWAAECAGEYPGATFPIRQGPVLAFDLGVKEVDAGAGTEPIRDMSIAITTVGGETPISAIAPNASPYLAMGAITFDRSLLDQATGYRFLVPYAADFVLDVTPQVNPPGTVVIR